MPIFVLIGAFEESHYDETLYYNLFFNLEENEFEPVNIASSTYGAKPNIEINKEDALAIEQLTTEQLKQLKEAAKQMVCAANTAKINRELGFIGETIEATADGRCKAIVAKECNSCTGKGKWINPLNEEDVRECFYCEGGQRLGYARDTFDQPIWTTFPEGTTGKLIDIWTSKFRGKETKKYITKLPDGQIVAIQQHKAHRRGATDEQNEEICERINNTEQLTKEILRGWRIKLMLQKRRY